MAVKKKKLSVKEQRELLKLLTPKHHEALKIHVNHRVMKGEGFKEIVSSIGNALSPIIKELGPTVLKELIIPLIKTKMGGTGLMLAGKTPYRGKGIILAGRGVNTAGR